MESRNIVFLAKSIDGYIAGKNGELEWLNLIPNPDHIDMGFQDLMQRIDAIIMGRTTYEMVLSFGGDWPYEKHVFVLSSTLNKVPKHLVDKVSLIKGSPQEILQTAHKANCYTLYIDGGKTVQHFLEEDLVDELIMTTIPIVLGEGIPLFKMMPKSLEFKHVKTTVFLDEIVQTHYQRKKQLQ